MDVYSLLQQSPVFRGVETGEIKAMLPCLGLRSRTYEQGDYILSVGDRISEVGFLVDGEIEVAKVDIAGNRRSLSVLSPGEMFCETLVCANIPDSPVCVQALEESEVWFLNFNRLISSCSNACLFHSKVFANLLRIIARNNIGLNDKIDIISQRTTREKISAYLVKEMEHSSKNSFEIPYNRGQLADYLSVDRSAMSRELGKMRDEGILQFSRNRFEILDKGRLVG